jgi:4-hydroxythreonine-4-phosphate dehydrogenase
MNNKIILIGGDPNSINSEIIFKTWKKLSVNLKKRLYLIANFELIYKQYKSLGFEIDIIKVKNINETSNSDLLKIIDIPLNFKSPFKVPSADSSKYISNSLNVAHKLAINKKISGFVNCPINKKLLKKNKILGVTEFLAAKSNIKKGSEVMLIHNKKLSVVPLTTHINIRNISKRIDVNLIKKKLTTLNIQFKKLFKIKPKIGILGLNPHNGELLKNSEEVLKIIPAIKLLKKKGLNISGPLVADTVFINDYKKYDVLVGMYHDQVLAPFKAMFHFNAINITLGLGYIRVSPDHGPAFDLIKKNKANCSSLLECIKFLNNL